MTLVSWRGAAWGCLTLGCLISLPSSARADYGVHDLGVLPAYPGSSLGSAINASGQATGYSAQSNSPFDFHGFRWTSGTGMSDLGALPGGNKSVGNDINDAGDTVGSSNVTTDGFNHPFLKLSGSTMVDLGSLGGTLGEANGINNSDWVTGFSDIDGSFHTRAFLKKPGQTMTSIGTLGGNSYGDAINDAGQIAGAYDVSGGGRNIFRWSQGGGMVDLGVLSGGASASAAAMNASGSIVGYSDRSVPGTYAAFIYRDGFGITQLAGLQGVSAYDDRANGIDAAGNAVGHSWTGTSVDTQRAVLWQAGGGVVDLNTLIDPLSGWTLTSANGINSAGQIVGFGIINGSTHAFELSPVPEPATYLVLGLGALVLLRRKRN